MALLALAGIAGMSAQKLFKAPVPVGQPSQSMMVSQANVEVADNQVWWGYYQDGVPRSALGTSQAEVVNQAILIPKSNGVVAGNTIKAVRFYLRDLNCINEFTLWLSTSLPASASKANILRMDLKKSQLVGGDESDGNMGMLNEIELTTPYTMGNQNIYVGYS